MDRLEEIEAEIALSVGLLLRLKTREALYAGWLQLFQRGIDPTKVVEGHRIPPDALQELLRNAASDADAFNACSTLAGLQLRAGVDIEPALREFAANTLLGKSSRPKRTKRSVGKGVHQDITRYMILQQALRFFPMQKGRGVRTEDGKKAKVEYPPDMFGVVSKALGQVGLPTTESQLKNLLNHQSKATIRMVGDWAMHGD